MVGGKRWRVKDIKRNRNEQTTHMKQARSVCFCILFFSVVSMLEFLSFVPFVLC